MRKVNIILSTLCIALATFALAFGNGTCIDEDFSQDTGLWTEYDPNGKIKLDYTTDHRLEFNNWIRPEPEYVSRPYSAQDFVLDFDMRITASGGNAKVIGPGFSDNLATIDQIQNGVYVVYYAGFPTVSPRLSINTRVGGTTEWGAGGNPPQPNRINIGKNVTYYVRLEKSGSTLTLSVFSDPGRTTHITGSPKTVTTSLSGTTFNYFYAVNGYTTSPVGNWEWTTGWIDNIVVSGQGGQPVEFPDPNLEQAIRDAIGKPTGDIYQSDLVGLTTLNAPNRNITDLTGIEYCTDLVILGLSSNNISDISPLTGLHSLRVLLMWYNQISDISSLAGLTNLEVLGLVDNQISDISPLAGLHNLKDLDLGSNQISDTSPLAGLHNLKNLYLRCNQVSDISPLSGLSNLEWLNLGDNQVSDISPLSGLTNLVELWLWYNQISDISSLAGLTNLEVLGLVGNQISDISPLAGLHNLKILFLRFNQISEISPLSGLTNLNRLWLNYNSIRDIQALADNSANGGLDSGDEVDIRWNFLDLTAGSEDMQDIQTLQNNGVTVFYEPQKARPVLTVTKAGTGDGTITSDLAGIDCGTTCTASYDQGTTVALTATPDANSVFAGWSGCDSSTCNECTVTLNSPRTISATFSQCSYDTIPGIHTPTSKRALIIAPYSFQGFRGYSTQLRDRLKELWGEEAVDFYSEEKLGDHTVTIPKLDAWLDQHYGLIHITTHGTYRNFPIEVFGTEAERDARYTTLTDTLGYGNTEIFKSADLDDPEYELGSRWHISVTANFINCRSAGFHEHPLVYMEGCYMGEKTNPELRNAFLCKGAGAYVGFDDEIKVCFWGECAGSRTARDVSLDFYNHLIDDGYTVKQATDALSKDPGDHADCILPFICERKVKLESYGNSRGRLILVVKGDVNGDGKLDVLDVRIVLQAALGFLSLTPAQQAMADVNGDGQVTIADAQELAARIIGIEY